VSPKAIQETRSLKMLREIIKPSKRRLTIEIPEQYVNKQIEILILPFFEMDSHLEIEKHEYDEDLQRLFRNAPNIKIDKNVDIDALMNEVNDVVL
jgi:hypothetical protein